MKLANPRFLRHRCGDEDSLTRFLMSPIQTPLDLTEVLTAAAMEQPRFVTGGGR
jgi:hypothetical protein